MRRLRTRLSRDRSPCDLCDKHWRNTLKDESDSSGKLSVKLKQFSPMELSAPRQGGNSMNSRKALLLSAAMLLLVFCAACGARDGAQQRGTGGGLASEEARLLALLPASNEVAGWTRGDARFFIEETLYDLINGAMENFVIYGFQRVVTVDYDNPDYTEQIVVELYHMADPHPDSSFKQIGAEGYIGGTALNFWSGNYYVKMIVFQESESLQREMEKIAEAISRNIGRNWRFSRRKTRFRIPPVFLRRMFLVKAISNRDSA
jgi:hypothetical protein